MVKALNRHAKFLRGRLGHAIDLKFTPALKFLHDESFDEAAPDEPPVRRSRASRQRPRSRSRRRAGSDRGTDGPPQEGRRGLRLDLPRQALRPDLHPRRRPRAPRLQRPEGGPRRHARPAGHRHPADRAGRGDQDRPVPGRRRQGLPLHHRLGRRPPPLRPRGRGHRHLRRAADRAEPSRRRCRPSSARSARSRRLFSAIKVDGERAYDLARAGEAVRAGGPHGDASTRRAWPTRRTPTTSSSRSTAARAPMSAPSSATWPPRSAPAATSAPCAAPASGRFTEAAGDNAGKA